MSTDKIRVQVERIKTLLNLQKDILNEKERSSGKELEIIKIKLTVTRDEMLKSSYSIGQFLKEIEEKV